MSGLVMGLVWELPLQGEFDRAAKYILLAYADHADQAGGSIYPSVDLIAKKTGYCERAVQHTTRVLQKLGYLLPQGLGPNGTNRYRIPLQNTEQGAKISPIAPDVAAAEVPENAPPVLVNAPSAVLKNAPEGLAPEPIEVIKNKEEEENGFPVPKNLSETLERALVEYGVYRSVWADITKRLNQGWSEEDVLALMTWMKSGKVEKSKAAQRFACRIREGTRAPASFYAWAPAPAEPDPAEAQADEPEEEIQPVLQDDPALLEPEGAESPANQAWQALLAHLRADLPRRIFECALEATAEFDGEKMLVRVAGDCEWMQDRLTRLAERGLAGILNRQVSVEFAQA